MSNKIKPYKHLDEWVPLSKAVDYAIIDDYDDAQVNRQRFNNWAIRGYRKLNLNLLRYVVEMLIPVNPKTGTAPLPDNFRKVISAGYYDMCGDYVPAMQTGMIEVYKDTKPKCHCDACSCAKDSMCNAVSYERIEENVTVAGLPYTNVTIRKFDKVTKMYKEQKEEWILVKDTNTIEQRITTRDLCELETKECGCIADTQTNVDLLKHCGCCGIWDYYGPHHHRAFCNDDFFSIDTKNNLIYIGHNNIRFIRLKFWAHLPMINGEVYVPAVSLECISAYILWKRDQRRKSVSEVGKQGSYLNYKRERRELRKAVFPIRTSVIENALNLIPY